MRAAASSLVLLLVLFLFSSWKAAAPAPPQTRPLRAIMVALGQDMSRVNDGIWHEDYVMIEQGARAIADHPRVPPAQMRAIREALGTNFEQFRQLDVRVHDTAVSLAEAGAQNSMRGVLERYGQLQQGCVACHAAFRDRVRAVLQPAAEGR